MPMHNRCNDIKNKAQHFLVVMHAAEGTTQEHTVVAQGTYQGACLVHARAQPASCHHQQNTTFISTHACNKGDDMGDTLQLHKARTKAHALFMPVHNQHHVIINKTLNLLAVMHAAEATTQETHCYCKRHVPRRVPRPCPFIASVI